MSSHFAPSFSMATTLVETAFLATREVLRMVRKISSVSRSSLATIFSSMSWWIGLSVADDLLVDELVDGALAGSHEARAHVDALGAERQRRDEAAAVAEAAGGDHRNLDLVAGGRDQNQAGRVVLAGMAGALKAVDRDRIDAHSFRRQAVTDTGAFVDDLDAVLLELGNMFLRLVARGLHDLDAGLDDGLAVFGV